MMYVYFVSVFTCVISYNAQDFNLMFYCGRLGTKVRDKTLAVFWASSRHAMAHIGQPNLEIIVMEEQQLHYKLFFN